MAEEIVFAGIKDNAVETESMQRYAFARQYCSGKAVLEIGCGARNRAAFIAENAKIVAACDLSKRAVLIAKKKFSGRNVFFVACNAEQLPFKRDCFETVVCLEVLEHVKKPALLRDEAKRVLTQNGKVVFSTPNKPVVSGSEKPVNPHHEKEFSLPELKQFFSGCFGNLLFLVSHRKKRLSEKPHCLFQQSERLMFLVCATFCRFPSG